MTNSWCQSPLSDKPCALGQVEPSRDVVAAHQLGPSSWLGAAVALGLHTGSHRSRAGRLIVLIKRQIKHPGKYRSQANAKLT